MICALPRAGAGKGRAGILSTAFCVSDGAKGSTGSVPDLSSFSSFLCRALKIILVLVLTKKRIYVLHIYFNKNYEKHPLQEVQHFCSVHDMCANVSRQSSERKKELK